MFSQSLENVTFSFFKNSLVNLPGDPRRPYVFRRLRKQNQNIQTKVPTTQPNPQYSAKNNVTIHMIYTFMPPPLPQTTMLYSYIIQALYRSSRNFNLIISNCLPQDLTNSFTTRMHLSLTFWMIQKKSSFFSKNSSTADFF